MCFENYYSINHMRILTNQYEFVMFFSVRIEKSLQPMQSKLVYNQSKPNFLFKICLKHVRLRLEHHNEFISPGLL